MPIEERNHVASFREMLSRSLKVDARRVFGTPMFYIMGLVALVAPVLILVMSSMNGESLSSVWTIIASSSSSNAMASMDIMSMCNMNLIYFLAAVLVCVYIGAEYRSGYAKNVFAIRTRKSDYIISKTLILSLCGMIYLLLFFLGSMIGGGIAGLSFALEAASPIQVAGCIISKLFLMPVMVSLFILASCFGKDKVWLSTILSLGIGMLLFMMIPMLTPLDTNVMFVALCLIGGIIFPTGIGFASGFLLKKTRLA